MTVSELTIKIKGLIWRNIKEFFHFQRTTDPVLVQNINYKVTSLQKKLLISYLSLGYFINLDNNPGRTIVVEIFKIIKVFSELGYCIDLINCNDIKSIELIENKRYNLIFGFGEVFYLMAKLQPEAFTVLYMTEQHPEFSYLEEKKRIDYYYARHKKHIPIARSGKFYKIKHMEKRYTQIITMSETEPLKKQYDKPYTIFPTGIINPNFVFKDKNHYATRKHFLWLGSSATIHKGLDLLIDIFSQRQDIYLHICGLLERDRKILKIPDRENIFEYGHIDIKSGIFLEIIEICSYSILPSCSEGCATSITTSMLHGLIPVVIKDAGFNRLGDKAIFLNDYKIEYIEKVLTKLANEDPNMLRLFSKRVFDFARKEFLISVFEENFKTIMNNILKTND